MTPRKLPNLSLFVLTLAAALDTTLFASNPIGFEAADGYVEGDLFLQPANQVAENKWIAEKPLWVSVLPGVGRDGTSGLLTAVTKTKEYPRIQLRMPPGPTENGKVRFGIDCRPVQLAQSVAVGLSVGRDATGNARGRALRLILQANGELVIVKKTVNAGQPSDQKVVSPHIIALDRWIRIEAIIDYEKRTSSVSVDGDAIAEVPFIIEGADGLDERGNVEISSGGCDGNQMAFDNLTLENIP